MTFAPFGAQCGEIENVDSSIDTYFDFNALQQSPHPSNIPASNPQSATTSPATTVLHLDPNEDQQTPAKPSHPYELWKQQTGIPIGSVPGLYHSNSQSSQEYPSFPGYGTGFDESSFMGSFNGIGSNSGLGMGMDMEMNSPSSSMPAFLFPPGDVSQRSQTDDFVDPSAISSQDEPPPVNVRFYPGMHQQQAALAKAQAQAEAQAEQQRRQQMQQQQRLQQQQAAPQQARAQSTRRSASNQPLDARTEETIARVVNQIRQASTVSSNRDASPSGMLPHVMRMKKDEEDMDEDERLLASEEGKKLSSKERRQLRNKVSARAFRSRRKEYIGQLEGEIANKNDECNELRAQNQALMDENARSRAFIEKILRHPAFHPFLEDLSRDESITKPSAAPAPTPAPARRDSSIYGLAQQPHLQAPSHHQTNSHVGMTLIPETPLDMSLLNLGNTWTMPNGLPFTFQQPRVFAVTELPEGPAAPLDVAALSGKGEAYSDEPEAEEAESDLKHDYPVVNSAPAEVAIELSDANVDEDDGNPSFALYVNTPAPASTVPASATSASEPKAITIESSKSSRFALVTSEEDCDDTEQSLMERLERMCARIEPVHQRLQNTTSRTGG
ncbi:hypothetical protein W97_09232 [Coniosporium apollinis CBS 100218]|uniref:BZIP domain-containing protein n=1 Tax=Coniosporium apollinis (strain CBS 100218) TaxID=1168221 RepID=R7Z729_CONA1|nr:uncharacterized protein W97_09232 [Coniosporium apollinis CBS 100218]EON69967.1 hypothetical protein W97_09232 [Coniosporium apollinis CBS 100218]